MPSYVYRGPIRLVVFDWAGTTVDHGCFAPVVPFIETLARHGIQVTPQQARGPMGLGKRDHLRALLALPEVTSAWKAAHRSTWTEDDLERLYRDDFVPRQLACVEEHSQLVRGLLPAVEWLRGRKIKIASTTGYFREAAERCWEAARRQGFAPEVNSCGSDVPAGRPAPWMIFRSMQLLDVYPPAAVIKIGDTLPDVGEGRNAGVWTAAVTRSSSDVGLTEAEFDALPAAEQRARTEPVAVRLTAAGAHLVIDSIADVPALVETIERRLQAGQHP